MTDPRATMSSLSRDTPDFRSALVSSGILIDTGVAGVYGKSSAFERVLDGFGRLVGNAGEEYDAEVFRFPPVLSRTDFESSDYLRSFPHLVGCVHGFHGDERDHRDMLRLVETGADWSAHFAATDLVLTPAACYPVYPMASGVLPRRGRLFDVQSYCFRREPSDDPARMQVFRMHEFVRAGSPQEVATFRDLWLRKSEEILRSVGVESSAVVAHDPFFGRGGAMLASSQQENALKFELVSAVSDPSRPTALVSCNYHREHFGAIFEIRTADGDIAHTACVGFGLERVTLALFRAHGFDIASWPDSVRTTLRL